MRVGSFFYVDRVLEDVHWDCPNCHREGTVTLRRPLRGYIFHCGSCRRWLYRLPTQAGERLTAELGC